MAFPSNKLCWSVDCEHAVAPRPSMCVKWNPADLRLGSEDVVSRDNRDVLVSQDSRWIDANRFCTPVEAVESSVFQLETATHGSGAGGSEAAR